MQQVSLSLPKTHDELQFRFSHILQLKKKKQKKDRERERERENKEKRGKSSPFFFFFFFVRGGEVTQKTKNKRNKETKRKIPFERSRSFYKKDNCENSIVDNLKKPFKIIENSLQFRFLFLEEKRFFGGKEFLGKNFFWKEFFSSTS